MSVDKFLVSGEKVVFQLENLKVDGEGGYEGYVTNKRVIFVKKNKVHEILNQHISSLSWERKRRFGAGMLILGLLLLILYGLGILFILIWLLVKKEYLMIYGGGRQIRVEDGKDTLNQLMSETRNQMAKVTEEAVTVSPVSERVIIKEREVVKVRCPYCGSLVDVGLSKCPQCGAKL